MFTRRILGVLPVVIIVLLAVILGLGVYERRHRNPAVESAEGERNRRL